MDNALLEPSEASQPIAQASSEHAPDSSKPARIPFISSSNAAELAKKSWEARRAKAALPKPALSILPDSLHEIAGDAPNALGLIQTHGKEQLATNILPDQERRVAELNAQLDGINRLIDKATAGQLVIGYDEDSGLVFASPRDIQALSKARRDILEMLFRIHGVSREPIAKTPTGNTKRKPFNMQVE